MVEHRTPDARRISTIAAFSGGLLTAFSAATAGLLLGQALAARLTIPVAEAPPPRCGGDYGRKYTGAPLLRFALIGDSTAAGYGVRTRAQTPGALLSTWLAEHTHRPVKLTCPAVVGAVSAALPPQVETVLEAHVDLAVILIGANDITTGASQTSAVDFLSEAVTQLRAAGTEVVVATCPDLGTIRPIRPPLRWLAQRWSRQLAAAQTVATVQAGGRAVALGDLLGPRFAAAPEQMFGEDSFHPSIEGYALAASVILPSLLVALGLPALRENTDTQLAPLASAAAEASEHAGTEISSAGAAPAAASAATIAPSTPSTLTSGPQGPVTNRWARLFARVRRLASSEHRQPAEASSGSSESSSRDVGATPDPTTATPTRAPVLSEAGYRTTHQ